MKREDDKARNLAAAGAAVAAAARGVTLVAGLPRSEERGADLGGSAAVFDTTITLGPDGELLAAHEKTHLFDREKTVFTPEALWTGRSPAAVSAAARSAASTSSSPSRRAPWPWPARGVWWCPAPPWSRGAGTTGSSPASLGPWATTSATDAGTVFLSVRTG